MISHEHKCIFVHIPKTAGTSINTFFHPDVTFLHAKPDYKRLFGWCPKRKLHMQHATAKQLLETELITQEQWDTYFKFTFVRNPWDRAYSDYLWLMKDRKIKDSFSNYIQKAGLFSEVLNYSNQIDYRGDHLMSQIEFLTINGVIDIDFIGRFENFGQDILTINQNLGIVKKFNVHDKKNTKRFKHYSFFYNDVNKKLVETKFKNDIKKLNYEFENKTDFALNLKKIFIK